jgi:hypothetical protein
VALSLEKIMEIDLTEGRALGGYMFRGWVYDSVMPWMKALSLFG